MVVSRPSVRHCKTRIDRAGGDGLLLVHPLGKVVRPKTLMSSCGETYRCTVGVERSVKRVWLTPWECCAAAVSRREYPSAPTSAESSLSSLHGRPGAGDPSLRGLVCLSCCCRCRCCEQGAVVLVCPVASKDAGLEELFVGVLAVDKLFFEAGVQQALEEQISTRHQLLFGEVRVIDKGVIPFASQHLLGEEHPDSCDKTGSST